MPSRPKAEDPDTPAPDEDLSDLNARIAREGAAATTAEARNTAANAPGAERDQAVAADDRIG